MTDRFGWTSDKWDSLSPETRGNLIANLDYWAERREKERKEAEKQRRKNK